MVARHEVENHLVSRSNSYSVREEIEAALADSDCLDALGRSGRGRREDHGKTKEQAGK